MKRTGVGLALAARVPAGLPIDRHDRISGQRRHHRGYPTPERRLELVRRDQAEHAPDRVVTRDAALKLHEASQPFNLGFGPQLHVDEVIHTRKHRAHRHRKQLDQVVARMAHAARFGNRDAPPRQRFALCELGVITPLAQVEPG